MHFDPSPVSRPKKYELVRVYIVLIWELERDVEDVAADSRFGYPEPVSYSRVLPALRHALGHLVLRSGEDGLAHFLHIGVNGWKNTTSPVSARVMPPPT